MTITEQENEPWHMQGVTGGIQPMCAYCKETVKDQKVIYVELIFGGFSLHRNCVVAFATKILNEFERL